MEAGSGVVADTGLSGNIATAASHPTQPDPFEQVTELMSADICSRKTWPRCLSLTGSAQQQLLQHFNSDSA